MLFLNKKECDFLRLIQKKENESIYKLARKIFSTVTISKRIEELQKKGLIKKELVGRINDIKLTKKGEEIIQLINKLREY